ncbi:MAG: DUF3179 domain-containing (seleno)protein [Bacteroidales bacterium]|jgi:hypothetical protein|nr:DUF3179 domain-containing (seleno)protein [Bacteroidales bacterium]
MKKALLFSLLIASTFLSCTKEKNEILDNVFTDPLLLGWQVPVNKLILSQLPSDPIPSIDNPSFEEMNYENINSDEIVFLYRYKNIVKVYPQSIMEEHEIVNDQIDDHYFAVTFCPRTGSALAWNREIDGKITEFGVSGHLYNENLIPYDRNTNSFWSQMNLEAIRGINAGNELKTSLLLSAKASTIQKAFPKASILANPSEKNSQINNLKQTNNLIKYKSELISGDYFGVINRSISRDDEALLFNYDDFNDSINVYQFRYGNSDLIVAGSKSLHFIVAFQNYNSDYNAQFQAIQNDLPVIFGDNKGNKYDISGLTASGPNAGLRLSSPISYVAHSFAWVLFFNDRIEYFGNN